MKKVLVIDDDPMMLRMAGLLLKKAGCETASASSAKEGEELIAAFEPDLIIADNEMPEETGIELFERLRAQGSELGLCLMSGTVTDELADRADRCRADLMTKPLVYDKVVTLINMTMNGG